MPSCKWDTSLILHVVFGPCWLVPPGALVGAYTDSACDGFFFSFGLVGNLIFCAQDRRPRHDLRLRHRVDWLVQGEGGLCVQHVRLQQQQDDFGGRAGAAVGSRLRASFLLAFFFGNGYVVTFVVACAACPLGCGRVVSRWL